MINKKFVSAVCAAAMTASAFASLTAFAAGEEILYSDTYDNYNTGIFLDATFEGGMTSTLLADLTCVGGSRNGGDRGTYTDTEGKTVYAGSYYAITEKTDADKFLHMNFPLFADFEYVGRGRWAHVDFEKEFAADESTDVIMDFDLRLTDGAVKGVADDSNANQTNPVLRIGKFADNTATAIKIDKDAAGIGDDWVHARVITTASGSKLYIDGTEVASAADANVKSFSQIALYSADGQSTITPPLDAGGDFLNADTPSYAPAADIDNVVVYSAPAGTATATSEAPKAQSSAPGEATPTPKPAADIDTSKTYTFEDDDSSLIPTTQNGTTATVVDGGIGSNTSKVMKIEHTSTDSTKYGAAIFDFSSVTNKASHIIIDYDIYVEVGSDTTRVSTILYDKVGSGKADGISSLIKQGVFGGNSKNNIDADNWAHTTVDVDLTAGTGTYTVTKDDKTTVVGKGTIATDLQSIGTLASIAWLANTSYIDNLQIQVGGSLEGPTPGPTSSVEGSGINLLPDSPRATFDPTPIEGEEASVAMHSHAKKAADAGSVTVYSDKAAGNSIYLSYDVYVDENDKLTLGVYGDSGKALGAAFEFLGGSSGTATITAYGDKGDAVSVGKILNKTWYRVLIEIPQVKNGDDTVTGNSTITIYNIDTTDCSTGSSVAKKEGITPRNLSNRGATSVVATVTGTPYIDNTVAYLAESGASAEPIEETPAPSVTPGPGTTVEGSDINLMPEDPRVTFDPTPIEGAATKILNHSKAKPVQAESISTYSEKAAGNSIYAAYDMYVDAGDVLKLEVQGDSGKAAGTSFTVTGGTDGYATVIANVNKGDTVNIGKVLNKTWYRVLIEVPQVKNSSDTTVTGNATFTIYNINAKDCSTGSVVVSKKGLTPRNLGDRGATSIAATVTGTPYIDNTAVYLAGTTKEAPVVSAVALSDDKATVTLTTDGAAGTAVVMQAAYDSDGRLTGVKSVSKTLEADTTSYEVQLDHAAAAGEKVIVMTKSSDGKNVAFGAAHAE